MSQITDDLMHFVDIASTRLEAVGPTLHGPRLEEAREIMVALVVAVKALDSRLDALERELGTQ